MKSRGILNKLKLAYSPISNFAFSILRHEPEVHELWSAAKLYVIAQRPTLQFDNIILDNDQRTISFSIIQEGNSHVLNCELDIYDSGIAEEGTPIEIEFGAYGRKEILHEIPIRNIDGMKFTNYSDHQFLGWLSPEKFIHHYLNNEIEVTITGNIPEFLKYKVHYIGKATKQHVWERLKAHETLQDILSQETSFTIGQAPTHEVALLLFTFEDNLEVNICGPDEEEAFAQSLFGLPALPEQSNIFQDAEKALIKVMQPPYNVQLFDNYPQSKDGIYSHKYDRIAYAVVDPITLHTDTATIRGNERDAILVDCTNLTVTLSQP